jgi:transcriptional regulator with XRE-family HTH domain
MPAVMVNVLDNLRQSGGLRGADVANIAAVSPATVSRWTTGKTLPHPRTQLVLSDVQYVVGRLGEFYAPEEIRMWLYSRHRLLDGKRPIELIQDDKTEEVLAVIESLDQATYS